MDVENRKSLEPTGRLGGHSWYGDSLRAGRSLDRILVGARFSTPVLTGPGANPASCKIGTGSLTGGTAAREWR